MSDPYNQYPNQYGAPGGYGAPQQGYPQQNSPYPQQGGYPPQQSYGQPGYDNQQSWQQNQQQAYGSYGPPSHGGFQNGQQPPAQYGQPQYGQPGYVQSRVNELAIILTVFSVVTKTRTAATTSKVPRSSFPNRALTIKTLTHRTPMPLTTTNTVHLTPHMLPRAIVV